MKLTFTTNTSVTLPPLNTTTAAITIAGTWGSGTMTVAVKDGYSGEFVTRDTATADYAQEVTIGRNKEHKITLSGATGANLTVYIEEIY